MFVYEDDLKKVTPSGLKKVHLFLFNDVLIVVSSNDKGNRYKNPHVIKLEGCLVWDVKDEESEGELK